MYEQVTILGESIVNGIHIRQNENICFNGKNCGIQWISILFMEYSTRDTMEILMDIIQLINGMDMIY